MWVPPSSECSRTPIVCSSISLRGWHSREGSAPQQELVSPRQWHSVAVGRDTGCCVLRGTCAGPEGTQEDRGGDQSGVGSAWGRWLCWEGWRGFLGANVPELTGAGAGREVIPGWRPDPHAAHPSTGSSSPSHPGAGSDSFPFSPPLALTSFRGFPWRADPAQPLPRFTPLPPCFCRAFPQAAGIQPSSPPPLWLLLLFIPAP